MTPKTTDLRAWQGITALAIALKTYPSHVQLVQDEYDLFDVRDVLPHERTANQTKLQRFWRLKDGATVADFNEASEAVKRPRGRKPATTPVKALNRKHQPEPTPAPQIVPLRVAPSPAIVVRTMHRVEPIPFDVSSPDDLAAALLALARAVYPDITSITLQTGAATHKARK